MGGIVHHLERYLVLPSSRTNPWIATLCAAGVIAIVYFWATRLGLALRPEPTHIAVFWPASGIAVGILVAAGRRASIAVGIGVMVGSVVAIMLNKRGLLDSLLLGGINFGEVVLLSWLLSRWIGGAFAFRNLQGVLGFLAATALAAAASGIGGAAILSPSMLRYSVAWQTWLPSHVIGIVVVAPLLIALEQLRRHPPSEGKAVAEAMAALTILVLASLYTVCQPTGSSLTFSVPVVMLPPLLWLATRQPPAFAIAGASIASSIVIFATTLGLGRFGDAAVPIVDRVHGAQLIVMTLMVLTLIFTAVFAELKLSNELLRIKEASFRQLLEALPAAIQTTDTAGRITYCNQAAIDLWGKRPELGKDTRHNLYRLYYPDGTQMADAEQPCQIALTEMRKVRGQDALLERLDGRRIPIIPCPSPLFDDACRFVGVVNLHLDITERKRAEAQLAESNARLELAHRAARVGSYTYDITAKTVRLSGAGAAMFGLPHRNTEITVDQWWAVVHRDDLQRLRAETICAFKERRGELIREFRIVLPGGEVWWFEARSLVAYDEAGRAERMTGVYIDVTQRRKAEDQKNLLIAELDHRVKNVLACVAAVAERSRECSRSAEEFLEVLNGRISSLANTHALLSRNHWEGVCLRELVRSELAPCMGEANNLIEGPDMVLSAEATQPMAMVLHELATNAAKYGALSNGRGQVLVRWRRTSNGRSTSQLVLNWREIGGPPVVTPNPTGYGTSVIRDLIPYELGGVVDYELAREGACCELQIPAKWLSVQSTQRGQLATAM